MTDKAVEAVARALCAHAFLDEPKRSYDWWAETDAGERQQFDEQAQAAITAYREHLEQQGLVVVPRSRTRRCWRRPTQLRVSGMWTLRPSGKPR